MAKQHFVEAELWTKGPEVLAQAFRDVLARPRATRLARQDFVFHAAHALGIDCPAGPQIQDWIPGNPLHAFLESLFWEWTRLGYITPELQTRYTHGSHVAYVNRTELGARILNGEPPHPLSPGYETAIATLPDEPQTYLREAGACLERGLLRAAVVMVGLAYEHVIHDQGRLPTEDEKRAGKAAMVSKNEDRLKAAEKVLALRIKVEHKIPPGTADRQAMLRALCAAMVVVDDRNDAAHPRPLNLDHHEVAEHIAHAPRFLGTLLGLADLLRPFVASSP